MLLRNLILLAVCTGGVLASCGKKETGNEDDESNYADSGPASCVASGYTSAGSLPISTLKAQHTSLPFQQTTKVAHHKISRNSASMLKVVGGDASASSVDCQADNAGAETASQTNTVAIYLVAAGESDPSILCTGTVVANNLILTAAHCFDGVDHSSTSPGYVVFSNSFASINTSGGAANAAQISCWQRHSNYMSCTDYPQDLNCILNDIAWIKIDGSVADFGYTKASLLSSPDDLSVSEEKLFSGFGRRNSNFSITSPVTKRCTSTNGNDDYVRDYINIGAASDFNSATFFSAYQDYLVVLGPVTGDSPSASSTDNSNNSAKGTCSGDSGGPVYVYRGGNWVVAALVRGSDSVLSPKPNGSYPFVWANGFDTSTYADCEYGYGEYTTVGNYIDWIKSNSGVSVTSY